MKKLWAGNKELVTSHRLAHVVAQTSPCKQYSQQSIKLWFTVQGVFKYCSKSRKIHSF